MAQQITLRWKYRQGAPPDPSDREDNLFNVSRIVKTEPSTWGPPPVGTDADINSRVLYNEMGGGHPIEYHVTDTVAEILALANG